MDEGNWVPMHKAGVAKLPHDRPYSEVEAMFSLSVDRDNGREHSVRSYARMWRWSRGKVERFLKSADSMKTRERATNEATDGPDVFMHVSNLRREAGHQQGHARATTIYPDPDPKERKRKRVQKPWHGLGKDLDLLLACEDYVKHLAQESPVLAQWTFSEIRVWCRSMIEKANQKRARQGKPPVTSPIHLISNCASRVGKFERPTGIESKPPLVLVDAAESMGGAP